ncbi:MAG TPA: DUF4097 family beta strand repeat-containing protein [bacterium]|nr:DUF4097 family beta strand repeat-containing protein [bacterium]HXK94489.1 DUF4097 family beta strand repeat-containing protein [bacterium]
MKRYEIVLVAAAVTAGLAGSVSWLPVTWAQPELSTEGYEQSGNTYIWQRDIQINVEEAQSAVFKTINGFVDVKPQEPDISDRIDVKAEIKLTRGLLGSEAKVLKVKESVDVVTTREKEQLRVEAVQPKTLPWGVSVEVNLTVKVPKELPLEVVTVNGAVTAREISAPVKLESTNGRITAEACAGPLSAQTVNGAVRVAESRREVQAETVNGSVEVEMTGAPEKDSSLETVNGAVRVRLPVNAGFTLDLENKNGAMHFESSAFTGDRQKHKVQGTIHGGGPVLRVRTVNGSITVE